jgi:transcriptional regulator with XRE-family HTH domain
MSPSETLDAKKRVGEFLKSSRVRADLSQAFVAKHLNLSTPQCVSNWETGRTSPPLKYLAEIAALYRVDHQKLFDLLVD